MGAFRLINTADDPLSKYSKIMGQRQFDGLDKAEKKAETRFEEFGLSHASHDYHAELSPKYLVIWTIFVHILSAIGKHSPN